MNMVAKSTQNAAGKSRKQAPQLVEVTAPWQHLHPEMNDDDECWSFQTEQLLFLLVLESFIFIQEREALCHMNPAVPYM